jgi:hypothetical protein
MRRSDAERLVNTRPIKARVTGDVSPRTVVKLFTSTRSFSRGRGLGSGQARDRPEGQSEKRGIQAGADEKTRDAGGDEHDGEGPRYKTAGRVRGTGNLFSLRL